MADLELEEGYFGMLDTHFTRAIIERCSGAGLSIFRDGGAPRGGDHVGVPRLGGQGDDC